MRFCHSLGLLAAFVLAGPFMNSGHAEPEQPGFALGTESRVLAVMDPIDLATQKNDSRWGGFLREAFAAHPSWEVVPQDTVRSRFRDYNLDPDIPCHEFQCSFDAGNILSAEFVLFGSVTPLDDLYAYTLNLVHVPTSQVVWSRVGEVRMRGHGNPASAMETAFARIAADLGPEQVRTGRREKTGLLTVLDLSAGGSTSSRIMAERVATHLYASRNYDIMGAKEMEELLAALDIRKASFVPDDSGIFALGGKMDITHLVYSRLLAVREGGLQLQLALYDIAARKKVREWPSQSTLEFRKLLEFEEKFFSSLFKSRDPEAGNAVKSPVRWTWAGAGLSLAAGAAFGYLSYAASVEADREYARYRDSRARETADSHQSKVVELDRSALVFGIASGVGLAGAAGFMAFSF